MSDYTAIVRGTEVEAPQLSHAEVMSLVRQYALARIVQNASVPSRRQRESATIVEHHEQDRREAERLERAIAAALARAGLK